LRKKSRAESQSAQRKKRKQRKNVRQIRSYKKGICETWGARHRRLLPYWFALGWNLMAQQEQEAALSEDRFTRDYLDEGKISYL
jgi:hypothetical protein